MKLYSSLKHSRKKYNSAIFGLPKPFATKSQTVMESDGCDEQDDIHFAEVLVSPDHVLGQLDISKVANKHSYQIQLKFPYFLIGIRLNAKVE